MREDPFFGALGRLGPDAVRIEVVQRRTRRFRLWGLFELVLQVLAFIILIPLWIVLLFSALSLEGGDDLGDSGSGGDSKRKSVGKTYGRSSLFTYRHEILVRLLGPDGVLLEEQRVTAEDQAHADQLMATLLTVAARARLVVMESLDLNPASPGPAEVMQAWYGGRPMMARPGFRSAESLEPELVTAGFEVERGDREVILLRAFPPASFGVAILVIAVIAGATLAIGVFGTPLSLILGAPFLLFAMWVARRDIGAALFDLMCALFRLSERIELRVTPGSVSYRHRRAWRGSAGSTEGSDLVAIGYSGGLGPGPRVDRAPPALRVFGAQHSLRLPSSFTRGVGSMVADWLTSTMLSLREAHERHDLRSRCAYCGTLYDLEAHDRCPSCGGAVVA